MFNQKNEQKKMKKFWNLMLAALVIFGAVACTENQEENVPQAELKPVLSFVANIANDETRVDLEEVEVEVDGVKKRVWNTIWSENETLYVYGPNDEQYTFTNMNSEDKSVFNCYEDGILELIGQQVTIDNNLYGIDSTNGKAGAYLSAYIDEFKTTESITFVVQSAFFHFTAEQEVTLTASEAIFGDENIANESYVNTMKFPAGEHWVAFLPCENVTFSYSIAGVTYKEIKDKTFEAKKIYNLGTLAPIYNVYVLPQPKSAISKWTKFNLYTWGEGELNNSWPGVDITANTKEINGYTYYAYQYPVEYNGQTVSVIVNNGSDQTADIKLGELNTDYYVVVNSVSESTVYTTAPAAGSVPEAKVVEDPKPDTVSVYLTTTWSDWGTYKLYGFGGTNASWGTFNEWNNCPSSYNQVIGGVTYKSWDIPASCIGKSGTTIIVRGTAGKQTADYPITFEAGKDVFITLEWKGEKNGSITEIASPYTK